MESLLFFLDSLAVIVLVIMGLRDDRRKPGTPARSYFRYIDEGKTDLGQAGTRSYQALQGRKPKRGVKS